MAHPICRGVGGAAVWLSLLVVLAVCAMAPKADARAQAPGAPGDPHTWAPADKHGFGTATALASNVWFTLRDAELSEAYYPDLGTPSLRGLEFAVTDGRTFLDRETGAGSEGAGEADRGFADLPPDHRDAPLATDQDLDLGPAGRQRARRRALRLPDGEGAGALRARRPGARATTATTISPGASATGCSPRTTRWPA